MSMSAPLGTGPGTVDRVFGKAYQIVRHVYDNLASIILVASRDAQIQKIVDNIDLIDESTLGGQMSTILAGVSNFRSTYAEAVADPLLPVGAYFTSAQSGELRLYKRIVGGPGYIDQGDVVAPISKTLLASAGGAALVGTTEEGVNAQEALDARIKTSVLAADTGAEHIGTATGEMLDEVILRLTPVSTDTASLQAVGGLMNTTNKVFGRLAYNTTTELLYMASGPNDGDAWLAVNGGDAIIPA